MSSSFRWRTGSTTSTSFCSNRKGRAMAKRFSNLVAKMPKQARERARARTQAIVSKIERREDMRVSTLITYVRAMGGDVEIIAHFPSPGGGKDKTIKLKPFVADTADAA